jgi:myo-inositol-1(or 4)-monophosphatase
MSQWTREGIELSKIALQVASDAARVALEGFRRQVQVSFKAGQEPFTEYDLRSEELIRERLAALTPGIPVVGEEQGGVPGSDATWYCDPIDGTVNFMRGHPFFAVSVGLERNGAPFAGAVVAPALRMWWRGSTDDRGFHMETPCKVSETNALEHAVITTGLPVRGRPAGEGGLELLTALSPRVRDVRRCGSAAIELCMVADGTYDAYVTRALSPWDTCAGASILLAAGGRWQTWQSEGRAYEIGCNSALFPELEARLRQACSSAS